jgi:hypothetical protein
MESNHHWKMLNSPSKALQLTICIAANMIESHHSIETFHYWRTEAGCLSEFGISVTSERAMEQL